MRMEQILADLIVGSLFYNLYIDCVEASMCSEIRYSCICVCLYICLLLGNTLKPVVYRDGYRCGDGALCLMVT